MARQIANHRLGRRSFMRATGAASAGIGGLALVGCGDDDDSPADAGKTPTTSEGGTPTPKTGGTYRWEGDGIRYVPATIDPHRVGQQDVRLWLFTGNLAVRRNAPATELVSELFSEWETVDGVEHVVTVRSGVKTHDTGLTAGRLFDAEDVAVNLERMAGLLDPDNAATYAHRGLLPGLVSAEAVDSSTVRVMFAKPTSFPWSLSLPYAHFLARESFESGGLQNADPSKISATGPWILSEYRVDESFTLKPNPEFWDGAPYMEAVVWKPTADRVSQMSSFIQGNGTYFNNPSRVERETIAKSREGSQLFAWPGSTCATMIFNVRSGPLSDYRVRRALHLATNYVRNQDAFWGEGFYTLAGVLNNAHPQGLPDDEIRELPGWREDKTADLKTANELLVAAGFPEGEGLSIEYLALQAWEAYGYDFAIRQMDDWRSAFPKIDVKMRLSADTAAQSAAQRAGEFQVSHVGVSSVSPPSSDLMRFRTDFAGNVSGYSNPEFDALIDKAAVAVDPDEVSEDIKSMQSILMEDLPELILHRLHQAAIYAPNVRGFPTIPGGSEPMAGNFENWDTICRHSAKLWFE